MTEQEDIPVPKNFELRYSSSPDLKFERPEAKFRSWAGEYAGATQIGLIVPWYLTEMKANQWQYRRFEERGPDGKTLYFEKGDEVSKVDFSRRLEPKEGGYITIVRAEVHPKGPEDFTVDEHLRSREFDIRPASFSPKNSEEKDNAETVPAIDRDAEEGLDGVVNKTAAGKTGADKASQSNASKSIRNTKLEGTDAEESSPRSSSLKKRPKAQAPRNATEPKEIRDFEESSR